LTNGRPSAPLRRWAESTGADALERRLERLFRAVPPPPALSAGELAEVEARLRSTPRARPLLVGRYAALLAVGLLAGTGFAVASYGVQRWVAAAPVAPRTGETAPPAAPERPPNAAQRGSSRVVLSPPAVASAGLESTPAPVPLRTPSTPSAQPGGPLARESELLARALTKLRSEGDAAGALAALDEYQREFSRGTLALESEVARLDAYLALGRHSEALALLDRLPLDHIGRGAEPRLLRAELRAREDPARAVTDFNLALAVPLSPGLEERALYGRASCRLRAGDPAGGRADLERYLERHPAGRFSGEARQRLATLSTQ
jgi:hypothetical protein